MDLPKAEASALPVQSQPVSLSSPLQPLTLLFVSRPGAEVVRLVL